MKTEKILLIVAVVAIILFCVVGGSRTRDGYKHEAERSSKGGAPEGPQQLSSWLSVRPQLQGYVCDRVPCWGGGNRQMCDAAGSTTGVGGCMFKADVSRFGTDSSGNNNGWCCCPGDEST
jgi:hypothetical protein